MKHYGELLKLELDLPIIRTTKKVEYVNLACGFDIETSSVRINGEKAAHMYIWALGLGQGEPVYYGRTWGEFVEVCDHLSETLGLHSKKLLPVYVHNLAYDFQFMRKYFDWIDPFAIDERKPLKAVCTQGIEFRCSYLLSGFNLENTAKNLTKYKTKKLVGDLDHELPRHHKTQLTPKELGYVKNDIEVITSYIQEEIETYGDISKIPMTNTGKVRKYVRAECYNAKKGSRDKNKYFKYRRIMADLTLDAETYEQLSSAFMGGFTHANANYTGLTIKGVSSVDFTSSYPSVMIAEKFPMSRFKPVKLLSTEHFNIIRRKHALIFNLKLTNVKAKISQEVYLSEHKCATVNAIVNNGRIHSADEIQTTITEVDLDIIERVYTWDDMSVTNVKQARKNYLPYPIVKSILDLYQGKTELKGVVGKEAEYLLSKGMLNSIYGMSVTNVVKDNSLYQGDEWVTEEVDPVEEINIYNESRNRFLYYPWGLWVTAYARRNLWTGILAVGDDYIYSDTDSMKLLNYEKHLPYFKHFDDGIISKMSAMCDFYKLDKKLLYPKTIKGEVKPLGVWDYEGTYDRFKTLGAKRYMIQDGDYYEITVAGLGKRKGIEYIKEISGTDPDNIFKTFENTLHVPANKTGKMTLTYIDDELKYKVTDHLGTVATVNPLSGAHMEPCDFTISISNQYEKFLNNLSKGRLLQGDKKI